MRIFNAVLSYFISKLYLKVTCFRSFAFLLKTDLGFFFFFNFSKWTWTIIIFFIVWPLATVAVYLVVKSFLLVSSCAIEFLCGLLENLF